VDELACLTARCSALESEKEGLWGEISRLLVENERLQGWVEVLQRQLEEARRAAKRQAAPFPREAVGESAPVGSELG
jgi:hypothetical protein